jgi:Family of unknown function (DUF6510)
MWASGDAAKVDRCIERRTLMDAVDGNAIGGLLIDVFGTEMTAANSMCGTCGTSRPVAELVVYRRAPGTVVRCRTCGSVLMVFVTAHDVTSADLAGLASLGQISLPGKRALQIAQGGERVPGKPAEGAIMPDQENMSMGTPDEESMSMGTPEEQMSMGTPGQQSMSMGTPDEEMSMGTPEEQMSMGKPGQEDMSMGTPDE